MQFRILIGWLLLAWSVLCNAQGTRAVQEIPPYYIAYLDEKINAINESFPVRASFVFVTDTHVDANAMHSPSLIGRILSRTSIRKVIWGGDAIKGHSKSIDDQWKKHTAFDDAVLPIGALYKVRGNHDFTLKEKPGSKKGWTYSQRKTAEWIFAGHPHNVVRNERDSEACYYYFDDDREQIRYIIIDTTDSVREGDIPWGTIVGVHQTQLEWIANQAVLTTPEGYDIIFVSHIPLLGLSGKPNAKLRNMLKLVDATVQKRVVVIDSVSYDFSKLRNVNVLMCLSGHNHYDGQNYRKGVLYVTTASDAAYDDYMKDPLVKDLSGRQKGTVNEQCFDCFTINKRSKVVIAHRIGIGGNRTFHFNPIRIKVGGKFQLRTTLQSPYNWSSYNNKGNRYDGNKWTILSNIVRVEENGWIFAVRKGNSIILAVNEKGDKDIFYVIVK